MADHTFWSSIGEIATWVALGGGVVVLNHIKNKVEDWYKQRKLHPIARSVLANRRVHALLVEVRAKTSADRALVYLFHNGQSFSNKNPLWRLSCTQEYCRDGISHEIGSQQNILASLCWDGLSPLMGSDTGRGVICKDYVGHQVYIMDVPGMNDSYYQRSLIARGVRTKIVTPLKDNNEVVGFVALHFNERAIEIKDIENIVCEVSESAANIHYELKKV